MEKQQQEESGLFAPFAVSLSPILFSEEEDNEYDSLNPADRRENTIVLLRNDRSPVHCMSFEDSPSSSISHIYKPGSGSYSPSWSESEEETELAYDSPTLLLEISSSPPTTSISEENNFSDCEQSLGFGTWTKTSSDSSSECEYSNSDLQSIREFKCNENSPSVRILPHYQSAVDDFTYRYTAFSVEMIQAVHSLRYPVEVNKWAAEYLNHQGIKSTNLVETEKAAMS